MLRPPLPSSFSCRSVRPRLPASASRSDASAFLEVGQALAPPPASVCVRPSALLGLSSGGCLSASSRFLVPRRLCAFSPPMRQPFWVEGRCFSSSCSCSCPRCCLRPCIPASSTRFSVHPHVSASASCPRHISLFGGVASFSAAPCPLLRPPLRAAWFVFGRLRLCRLTPPSGASTFLKVWRRFSTARCPRLRPPLRAAWFVFGWVPPLLRRVRLFEDVTALQLRPQPLVSASFRPPRVLPCSLSPSVRPSRLPACASCSSASAFSEMRQALAPPRARAASASLRCLECRRVVATPSLRRSKPFWRWGKL